MFLQLLNKKRKCFLISTLVGELFELLISLSYLYTMQLNCFLIKRKTSNKSIIKKKRRIKKIIFIFPLKPESFNKPPMKLLSNSQASNERLPICLTINFVNESHSETFSQFCLKKRSLLFI